MRKRTTAWVLVVGMLHAGPADAAMVASTAAAALAGGERLLPPRPVYLRPPDVTLPGVAAPA